MPAYAGNDLTMEVNSDGLHHGATRQVQIVDIIENFCRTVSLDPSHKSLRENLSAIANSPLLSAEQRADALRIEDLFYHIKNLNRRLDYLNRKNNAIKMELAQKGADPGKIEKEMLSLRETPADDLTSGLSGAGAEFKEEGQLAYVIRLLIDEKKRLARALQESGVRYQWLKSTREGAPTQTSPPTVELTEQPVSIFSLGAYKAAGKPESEMSGRADPGPHVPGGSETVNSPALFEKITKIEKLSEQLVDLSLKMEETQALLRAKEEITAALESQLNEVEQRFLLEQKIIQDKDAEIKTLYDALAQTPQGQASASGDEQVYSLEGSPAETEAVLNENGDKLDTLEKDLADFQRKYRLSQEILMEKERVIAQLQQDLALSREQIEIKPVAETSSFLDDREREIKELNGVVNIYKYALEDAIRNLRDKSEDLKLINEELAGWREMVQGSGAQRDKRDAMISALKEALRREREKEDNRNTNLRAVIKLKDHDIFDLKGRLSETERNLKVADRVIQEKTAFLEHVQKELAVYKGFGDYRNASTNRSYTIDTGMGADSSNLSRDRKLIELNSMLNLYRDKLSDEHRSVRERKAIIEILEGRLGAMQDQISEKDEVLVKTQGELIALKERLQAVEDELRGLKDYPQRQSLEDSDIEEKFGKLQEKFEDIEHFLLENLYESDRMNAQLIMPRLKP